MGSKPDKLELMLLRIWYAIIVFIQHDIIQYIDHKIYAYKRKLLNEMEAMNEQSR